MPIDIEHLSEAELIDLNRRVVARVKFLQEMRNFHQMLALSVGDRVSFHPASHGDLTGIIVKVNRKTVTVLTDDRQQWNVAPGLLTKVISPEKGKTSEAQIIPLPSKK
jgi:hypothetical protein